MRKLAAIMKLVGLALLLTSGLAEAALVTYRVTGTVASAAHTGISPAGTFVVGDAVEAFVTFDTSAPDLAPGDPNYADYHGIVTSATLSIGTANWQWSILNPEWGRTRVGLNGAQGDEFVDTVIWGNSGLRTHYMVLALLNDPDQDFLTNDAFAIDPSGFNTQYIDLNDFQYKNDLKQNYDWSVSARATGLTWTVVPLPAAVWMFGSAIAGLFIFRRTN